MKKKLLSLSFLLILLPLIWPLFKSGFFTHHDDLQVMRVFEMKKCLLDLQIPCRWVPDMGYGYGFPLFNYYSPFAYYLGGILSFVFGYITSVKILFLLTFILSFLGMYLLAKEFFGFWGALVSSILFVYAPYRALDVYVRGALAEIFAISLVPFIFYFISKLSQKVNKFYFFGLVVSLSSFLLSHNVMVMLFLPEILGWAILSYFLNNKRSILFLFLSFALSFGVASFFLLPAFGEKNLVQIESLTQNELNFRAHFVKVSQLFWDRSWHYGASNPQQEDTISFQVGWPHWWFLLFSLPFLLATFFKGEWFKKDFVFVSFMFLVFLFSVFMTHNKSAFIWEKIPILSFTQFPWRFLSLSIFSSSIIGGYFVFKMRGLDKKYVIVISLLAIFLTIFLNYRYFRPERFFATNDREILSGESWKLFQKGAINDYLPVGAKVPLEPSSDEIKVNGGEIFISGFTKKTNSFSFSAKVKKGGEVEVPIFDFPKWEIRDGGQILQHGINDKGLIVLKLSEGEYLIKGKLVDTRIRRLSNFISLASLFLLFVLLKNEKIFKISRG